MYLKIGLILLVLLLVIPIVNPQTTSGPAAGGRERINLQCEDGTRYGSCNDKGFLCTGGENLIKGDIVELERNKRYVFFGFVNQECDNYKLTIGHNILNRKDIPLGVTYLKGRKRVIADFLTRNEDYNDFLSVRCVEKDNIINVFDKYLGSISETSLYRECSICGCECGDYEDGNLCSRFSGEVCPREAILETTNGELCCATTCSIIGQCNEDITPPKIIEERVLSVASLRVFEIIGSEIKYLDLINRDHKERAKDDLINYEEINIIEEGDNFLTIRIDQNENEKSVLTLSEKGLNSFETFILNSYIFEFEEVPIIKYNSEIETNLRENEQKDPINKVILRVANAILPKTDEFTFSDNINKQKKIYRESIERGQEEFIEDVSSLLNKPVNDITGFIAISNPVSATNELRILKKYSKTFNGVVLEVSEDEANIIKDNLGVKNVYQDQIIRALLKDTIHLLGIDAVWRLDSEGGNCYTSGEECLTGEGVSIGIIDTGVDYSHPDLGASEIQERDFEKITDKPIGYSPGYWHDQIISMYGNKLAYISGKNIMIYSFDTKRTQKIEIPFNILEINKISFKNNKIVYSAIEELTHDKIVVSFNFYDLETNEHKKILYEESRRGIDIMKLDITDNKILFVYTKDDGSSYTEFIKVYDINSGQIIGDYGSDLIKNGIHLSDNNLVYSALRKGNIYCYDFLAIHNIDTGETKELELPDLGPVLDFDDDWILYVDCSITNFDPGWKNYHLYNIKTEEIIPIIPSNGEIASESYLDALSYLSTTSIISKGAIGDDVIFFSKDVNTNNIMAYDLVNNRYVQINNYFISGSIDAEGNKVCFVSSNRYIYCHDYDFNYDYPVYEVQFNDKVVGGYDFVNNDNDPMDDNGHGTHVAATAAGKGILNGIAPDAKIYAYKVLNSNGKGRFIDAISAIERAVDPNQDMDTSDHLDIISLSFGNDDGSPDVPQSIAVDYAAEVGIVPVVAGGNRGSDYFTIGSPGTSRKAITVGAVDKNDRIAPFSSRGPVAFKDEVIIKPDILAPGVDICAAQWGDSFEKGENIIKCNNDDLHVAISGTSMATPHISGIVALLKQLHPEWEPYEIKSALVNNADDLGYDKNTQGGGRVNVRKSMNPSVLISPSSLNFGVNNNVAALKIRNIRSEAINLELSANNIISPKGSVCGKLSFETNNFILPAGEEISIQVTLDLANSLYGEYYGDIIIREDSKTYIVPFSFVKRELEICDDNIDNNRNGDIDCRDSECIKDYRFC